MAFCDLFKEFQPIRVDEDIYLRQTDPKRMPDLFGKSIMMRRISNTSVCIKDRETGMRKENSECRRAGSRALKESVNIPGW